MSKKRHMVAPVVFENIIFSNKRVREKISNFDQMVQSYGLSYKSPATCEAVKLCDKYVIID